MLSERFQAEAESSVRDQLVELYERATRVSPRDALATPEKKSVLDRDAQILVGLIGEATAVFESLEERLAPAGKEEEVDLDNEILDVAFSAFDGDTPSADPEQTVESTLREHVAGICFMARLDLQRAARELYAKVSSTDDLLASTDSARRKIRRSLAVVVEAVARLDGDESPIQHLQQHDVEAALAVRRLYSRFRRSLPPAETAQDVVRTLRLASVSLAKMVAHVDFSEVRMRDRLLLLSLQRRVIQWARDGAESRDGDRLFADLTAAANLIQAVNNRQELLEHDRLAVRSLLDHLSGRDQLDDVAVTRLLALEGRTAELDELIFRAALGSERVPKAALVETLQAVERAL